MEIVAFFFAAFGYLALLAAILVGMLFVGEGTILSYLDAAGSAAPRLAALVDLGLLVVLAVLHRWARRALPRPTSRPQFRRRHLELGARAWVVAAVLLLTYALWEPLPYILWSVAGPLLNEAARRPLEAGTYGHALVTQLAGMLGQPLYAGILIAMWATSTMSVGRLLLASAVSVWGLFDCAWSARRPRDAAAPGPIASLQGQRVPR